MKSLFLTFLLITTAFSTVTADVFVTFDGDTVRVWDTAIQWSCGGSFTSIVRFSNDTIYVTERDTIPLVTCLCYFDVCTKLTGLQPGSYRVVVTRRHEFYQPDTVYVSEQLAGYAAFSIASPPLLSQGLKALQTPCRSTPTLVSQESAVPLDCELLRCYPNPFNPSTTIRYAIPMATRISLVVFNLLGQHVRTLESGFREAGTQEATFDAGSLPSGTYVVYLDLGSRTASARIILTR